MIQRMAIDSVVEPALESVARFLAVFGTVVSTGNPVNFQILEHEVAGLKEGTHMVVAFEEETNGYLGKLSGKNILSMQPVRSAA